MYLEEKIERLILSSLIGNISSKEIILLSEWLKADEENELIFHQIKEYWNGSVLIDNDVDSLQLYDKILSKVRTPQTKAKPKVKRIRFGYIAASIAAVFIGLLIWFGGYQPISGVHYYSLISGDAVSEFILPDSTRVLLNKNSKLTYDNAFGKDYRKVQVDGEAYFDVSKDEHKKFIVNINGSTVTALGTSFTVKNKLDEDYISVLLVEGSVEFESGSQNILLAPNQQLVCNKSNNFLQVIDADIETSTAWKANLIRYKSVTFSEVMKMLEEHYAVKIYVDNEKLKSIVITGTFDSNMTVEQILNIMRKNIRFKVNKVDNTTYHII